MSLTLPIQVGKQYVRRDGAVVTARKHEPGVAEDTVFVGSHQLEDFYDCHVFINTGKSSLDPTVTRRQDLIADCIPATGHPHAALMAQYAADAAETAEPWLRWQCQNPTLGTPTRWSPLGDHPEWNTFLLYRRKPKTIRIGEHDVPEPFREELAAEASYWMVRILNGKSYPDEHVNGTISTGREHVASGLVHLTREAAEQHARALLAFTQVQA